MAFIEFDGGYYEGEVHSGIPDGEGVARYKNGCVYSGQWSDGKLYGKGKFIDSNGVTKYEGEFYNNKKSGKGTYYFDNGSRIEGIFSNDHFESGTLYYIDGCKYVGAFDARGYEHGYGTLYYPNGDYFKGQWQHGRVNGEGVLYYATGVTYKCRFVDGKEEGTRVYDYPFLKIKYVAEYIDGKQVSAGVYYGYDGKPIDANSICVNYTDSAYLGGIKDGKLNGIGIINMKDGRRFVGGFENNTIHGNGTLYYTNGNRLVGKWNQGHISGRAVRYYADGTKSLLEYKNGEEILLAGPIKANENFSESKVSSQKSNSNASKTQTISSAKPVSTEKKRKKYKCELLEGVATHEYPEGKYVGMRFKGKRFGFATMYYPDGSYIEGSWNKDKIHNKCKMYFTKTIVRKNPNGSEIKFEKGSIIEGIWKNSKNGKHMTLILPNGTKKKIELKHGNFILK